MKMKLVRDFYDHQWSKLYIKNEFVLTQREGEIKSFTNITNLVTLGLKTPDWRNSNILKAAIKEALKESL